VTVPKCARRLGYATGCPATASCRSHCSPHASGLAADAALVGDLVENGAFTVAVTAHKDLAGTAAQLSTFLHADRVLKASYSLADGADLRPAWHRPEPEPAQQLP
jgi:hypothetical protein